MEELRIRLGKRAEGPVKMQRGPVQLPHVQTLVPEPSRHVNSRRDSGLERPIRRGRDERANESASGCGESD